MIQSRRLTTFGFFHSRTTMPLLAKREWETWNWWDGDNITDLASTRICLDGDLGTVLKAYREVNKTYNDIIKRDYNE